MDKENRALGLARNGEAFGVEDANFRIRLLDPKLMVVRFGGGLGCHCRILGVSLVY